ncbi:rhodanese-like domain-containing protein [Clostridiales bacterium F-3ap]|uniref:Rhodanese-like domain-containing protein n=2 Tax=Anaerotalea alkaliphila TaxID=2662126 RepID=A0A7X5HUW1_9FIRM|nr:rhodanese-like domain-containing protein [Anaerotalea alkaliphila]
MQGVILLGIGVLLAACAQGGTPGAGGSAPEYRKITPEEAKTVMDGQEPFVLVDVRTKEEYDGGHIPGALLLPDADIERLAPDMLPDKEAKILLYCRSGRRSELAARKLLEMGYTQVLDFGGILDWKYGIE